MDKETKLQRKAKYKVYEAKINEAIDKFNSAVDDAHKELIQVKKEALREYTEESK